MTIAITAPPLRLIPPRPAPEWAGLQDPSTSAWAAGLQNHNSASEHGERLWANIRKARSAVRGLREIRSLRLLLDATPAAICELGFDRAMVSRVEESNWVVERFFSDTDAGWASEINEIARQAPARLSPSLFETDMVRRRVPLLVTGAQQDTRVDRALAEVTGSTSYVAAPIMPDGRVIGFLHADRYHQSRPVDQDDLELLAFFGDLFGQVLERTLLLERLDSLRESVGTLTGALNGTVSSCRTAAIDMSPEGSGSTAALTVSLDQLSAAAHTSAPAPDSVLTPRELDVLKLMATGDTNSRIARRLVISEGTVKSHVKHILRKLGAANRAEAVCRWLQGTDGRPGQLSATS
jgi:DNA-binding CsgD family transcriptional regulator